MIYFLTLSEVLQILENQIKNYGGSYSVRDISLLSSALCIPESSFNGQYLHKTIPAMAAAYAYHICQNHPFFDGNKRVALAASLVFLDINEPFPKPPQQRNCKCFKAAKQRTTEKSTKATFEYPLT